MIYARIFVAECRSRLLVAIQIAETCQCLVFSHTTTEDCKHFIEWGDIFPSSFLFFSSQFIFISVSSAWWKVAVGCGGLAEGDASEPFCGRTSHGRIALKYIHALMFHTFTAVNLWMSAIIHGWLLPAALNSVCVCGRSYRLTQGDPSEWSSSWTGWASAGSCATTNTVPWTRLSQDRRSVLESLHWALSVSVSQDEAGLP